MKIAFTSDLHVDTAYSNRKLINFLVRELERVIPDVFILCGDLSPFPSDIDKTLSCFTSLSCVKFFVAGNHDVWIMPGCQEPGRDSLEKYLSVIPDICARNGFICLDNKYHIHNGYGFAGSMGWYDYSLRNTSFDHIISYESYEKGRFMNLQWNDCILTDWKGLSEYIVEPYGFSQVCRWMTESLTGQLRDMRASGVAHIIIISHFVPGKKIIRYSDISLKDFVCAYLGSNLLDSITADFPEVSHWICGHLHRKFEYNRDDIEVLCSPVGYLRGNDVSFEEVARESLKIFEVQDGEER